MSRNTRNGTQLSIVVPLFNEVSTIDELQRRLTSVLFLIGIRSEIIYVDDGSSDGTAEALQVIEGRYEHVRVIRLARNYGQTAALAAGFDAAAGEVIVAMDGDLQHAPEEIPKLLAKLAEGYDIVSGWRAERVDNLWTRRLPSKIANWLMAKLSGVSLHDFGTTFKAYRAPAIKRIRLYGDLHRFIPALASWGGARIAEVPIANIPRPQNQSHYGLSRTWRVAAGLGLRTPHFIGRIDTGVLSRPALRRMLRRVPAGVTELMVHPGYVDEALRRMSTRLVDSRLEEVALLCSMETRALLVGERIQLVRHDLARAARRSLRHVS